MRNSVFNIAFLSLIVLYVPKALYAQINLEERSLENLNYQEVYYHFFRKDEFNGLVNFHHAMRQDSLPAKAEDKELLMAGLYYKYGLFNTAENIFKKIIKDNNPAFTKAVANFYLAKLYLRSGDAPLMSSALKNSVKHLPESLENEHQYLQGMQMLLLDDIKSAEKRLKNISKKSKWYFFLSFNVGAAYFKSKNPDAGEKYLKRVGSLNHDQADMLALKDKANITLGYYFLRNEKYNNAASTFEKVRLQGPFSNKALLGLGWAYSNASDYRNAIIPWSTLSNKDTTQLTVQEARLALPYAYKKLNSEAQSLAMYEDSIEEYEKLKTDLDEMLLFSQSASVFDLIVIDSSYDDYGISQEIIKHRDSRLDRLMLTLLNEKSFQKLLDEHRDLRQLQLKLSNWFKNSKFMAMRLKNTPEFRKHPDRRSYMKSLHKIQKRIKKQKSKLTKLVQSHELLVQAKVTKALEKKRQFVISYLSQARFAYAELLDKAAVVEQ